MLLLNVVGIIAYRTKVVDKNGGRQFSNFVLEIVTPVLVVNAYADVEYESRLVVNMLWTFLLAAAAYGIFIAAVYLLIRPKPGRETEIERFPPSTATAALWAFRSPAPFWGMRVCSIPRHS